MDRISLSRKHGVFKSNKAKERQNFKKKIRYFTLEEPNICENVPESGSVMFIKEEKRGVAKLLMDGDVTRRLLALVPRTIANVPAVKSSQSTCNDVKGDGSVECNLKISGSTGTLASVNKGMVGSPKEIKKSCVVNGIASSSSIENNHFDTSCKEKPTMDSKKKKKKEKLKLGEIGQANKNSTQNINYALETKEKKSDYTIKLNRKRSFVLEQSSNEQDSDEISAILNGSSSSMNSESLRDSGPKINCQIKSSKNHKTQENRVFIERRKESDDKTILTTPLLTEDEEGKQLPYNTASLGKKHKSSTHNLLECTTESKKKNKGAMKKINGSSPPALLGTSDKQNKKESKKFAIDENVFDHHEKRSGGWNVIDLDKHMESITISLNKVQKLAKNKNKNSNIHKANFGMLDDNSCPRPELETAPNNENESTCNVIAQKVSKKLVKRAANKPNQEFRKSQPILIEMNENSEVPSNPFHTRESDLKGKTAQLTVNMKSDQNWKPSTNIHGTEKWEIQYGNTKWLQNKEDVVPMNREKKSERETTENLVGNKNAHRLSTASTDDPEEFILANKSSDSYQLFDVSGTEVILALPPSSSVFFQGAVKVKVLVGNVAVMGYEISHTNPKVYTVYSPKGISLLGFQSCIKHNTFSSKEKYWKLLQEKIEDLNEVIQEKVLHSVPEFSSLLLLQSVSETFITCLLKYLPSLQYFPSILTRSKFGEDSSGILKAVFIESKSSKNNLYNQPSPWNFISSFIMKRNPVEARVLVCGGKNVGKSTFLRFLVNQTLSQVKEALYIDFDIGQCEFSVPGCVSAIVVKNPLLGPNFTHLTHPERLVYVGELNVSVCVERYLKSVQYILDWCCAQPHLAKLPWFINTMGFVHGLGIELAISIIKMVNPSDVIQIESSKKERNFPLSLKFEEVQNYATSLHSVISSQERSLKPFSFHMLPCVKETSDDRGVQAKVARETVLISYFSQVVAPPAFSLLEVSPHVLSFSGLKLCVSHEKVKHSDYLAAMNANLVALCNVQGGNSLKPNDPDYPEILENAPLCHCFGFGIVRGVDLEKKKIFVISPLQTKKMRSVNCLVLGSVHLPETIFTSQDEARGTIPYVVEGVLLPLARGVRAAKSVPKLKK